MFNKDIRRDCGRDNRILENRWGRCTRSKSIFLTLVGISKFCKPRSLVQCSSVTAPIHGSTHHLGERATKFLPDRSLTLPSAGCLSYSIGTGSERRRYGLKSQHTLATPNVLSFSPRSHTCDHLCRFRHGHDEPPGQGTGYLCPFLALVCERLLV